MDIKFTQRFTKLHDQKFARLLMVVDSKFENLTEGFLAYDTDGRYPMPKEGNCLILIFMGNDNFLFTTVRDCRTPEKIQYYKSHVGRIFNIITPEEGNLKFEY